MEKVVAIVHIAAVGVASILPLLIVEMASGAYLWQDQRHVMNGQPALRKVRKPHKSLMRKKIVQTSLDWAVSNSGSYQACV